MKKLKGLALIFAAVLVIIGLLLALKFQDSLWSFPSIIALIIAIIVLISKPNKIQKSTSVFIFGISIIGIAFAFVLSNQEKEVAIDQEFIDSQEDSSIEAIEDIESADFIENKTADKTPEKEVQKEEVKEKIELKKEEAIIEEDSGTEEDEGGLLAPDIQ